jgi:hypothetical protein
VVVHRELAALAEVVLVGWAQTVLEVHKILEVVVAELARVVMLLLVVLVVLEL